MFYIWKLVVFMSFNSSKLTCSSFTHFFFPPHLKAHFQPARSICSVASCLHVLVVSDCLSQPFLQLLIWIVNHGSWRYWLLRFFFLKFFLQCALPWRCIGSHSTHFTNHEMSSNLWVSNASTGKWMNQFKYVYPKDSDLLTSIHTSIHSFCTLI